MKQILRYLLKRTTEPSSQAGLAAVMLALGLPADSIGPIYTDVIAASGAAAFFIPEATTKPRD